MAERATLGGHQNPHGLQPGSLRREMCRACQALETAARLWPQRNLAPARCMPSRPESVLQRFRKLGRTSLLRSDGVLPTRVFRETRRLTSGPSWQRRSPAPTEWNGDNMYADRYGRRPMPLPRALAHLKREISEKKWSEARRWAEGRITAKKYGIPDKQRPNRVADGVRRGWPAGFTS
jgi:hypothetical protein